MTDTVDAQLLSILVCPKDHGPLYYTPSEALYNPRLGIKYPIIGGIPVLIIDQAITVTSEAEALRLAAGTPTGGAK